MAWLTELQEGLVEAAGRERRRRVRRQRGLLLAALLPLVAVLGLALARPDRAEAGSVRVTAVPGGIEVTVVDLTAAPRTIAADLADAGLVVQLEEVATGPSRVGRLLFLRAGGSGAEPGGTLFVPAGGVVRIGAGGIAPDGVPYEAPTDAFAPGEDLHCLGARGGRAGALAAAIADGSAVEVTWRGQDGQPTTVEPTDARVVSSAEGRAAGVVEVFVGAGPVPVEASCP